MQKGRPYLVISRSAALLTLRRVLVAPVTTRIRTLPSTISLGPEDGLLTECIATFDNVQPFPKALLTRRLGALGPGRLHEICDAMSAAIDC